MLKIVINYIWVTFNFCNKFYWDFNDLAFLNNDSRQFSYSVEQKIEWYFSL